MPGAEFSIAHGPYRAVITARGAALHGFTTDRVWEMRQASENSVVLGCRSESGPEHRGLLDLSVTYSLTADGLKSTVNAVNAGQRAAPYGVCPHPYQLAGPAPVDEWILELPASEFLEVSP